MFITEIVKSRGHLLTATDRKLVGVLRSHPAEAAFWFANDLTAPLGLHQSAATRLAQRLGFAGYPQLRDALRQDYLAGNGPSQRLKGRLDQHPLDEVLRSFVDDEVEALRALPQHVSQDELDDLAGRVLAASTVYLFGQGNATVLVDQLTRRLQRFGVRPVALVGSRRDIAEAVTSIGPDDLLVVFAFRRAPSVLGAVLDLANAEGVHSVLITDTLLSLQPSPSAIIAAPRGGTDAFLSLTVPMAISNALVLTIAQGAPEHAVRSLDRLGAVLDTFDA
ncbi:RpiR family transcriptional regulator [Glaciihabitans tibetensis]|uniref:RpiR family transcriptional regulator n=1 Tax=Glaciihabitans tibetensis TaxID=1266600 RepID=A0A2T0V5K5_9MICO|nr:MurR/RpiR family transcriptional regulator [Glaciihabitans tibetensis]PRY65450.1 RpiR family transcriptional regulator [Glaciihabitans tibetensis]